MISHAWSVLCDKTLIDKETNNIVLDVVEQINIKGSLPAEEKGIILATQIEFVSMWYKSATDPIERTKACLKIFAPNGQQIISQEMDLDLSQSSRHRTRCKMNALPVPNGQIGIFHFTAELLLGQEWQKVADIPLEVVIAPD